MARRGDRGESVLFYSSMVTKAVSQAPWPPRPATRYAPCMLLPRIRSAIWASTVVLPRDRVNPLPFIIFLTRCQSHDLVAPKTLMTEGNLWFSLQRDRVTLPDFKMSSDNEYLRWKVLITPTQSIFTLQNCNLDCEETHDVRNNKSSCRVPWGPLKSFDHRGSYVIFLR